MANILIVDDNIDFAKLLYIVLDREGYKTHIENDAQRAINHIEKTDVSYDLVITDIIMPNADGFDLIEYLQKNCSCKIIAVSGGGVFMNSEKAIAAITEKVDATFEKPVDTDTLIQGVRDILYE